MTKLAIKLVNEGRSAPADLQQPSRSGIVRCSLAFCNLKAVGVVRHRNEYVPRCKKHLDRWIAFDKGLQYVTDEWQNVLLLQETQTS